jgi:hypothetical protein
LLESVVPHLRLVIDYLMGRARAHSATPFEGPSNLLKDSAGHVVRLRERYYIPDFIVLYPPNPYEGALVDDNLDEFVFLKKFSKLAYGFRS